MITTDERKIFLCDNWGERVLNQILISAQNEYQEMTVKEFLSHCCACGGNWGGMLLTGMKNLFPHVYDAVPDNMGVNAFACICDVLTICGVHDD